MVSIISYQVNNVESIYINIDVNDGNEDKDNDTAAMKTSFRLTAVSVGPASLNAEGGLCRRHNPAFEPILSFVGTGSDRGRGRLNDGTQRSYETARVLLLPEARQMHGFGMAMGGL